MGNRQDGIFPFTQLPKELRLAVYEHLHEIRPKQIKAPENKWPFLAVYLLPGYAAPSALLQTSKAVNAEVEYVTRHLNSHNPTIFFAASQYYNDLVKCILEAWESGLQEHMRRVQQDGRESVEVPIPLSIYEYTWNELAKQMTATEYFYPSRGGPKDTVEGLLQENGNYQFHNGVYEQFIVRLRQDQKVEVILTETSSLHPQLRTKTSDIVSMLLIRVAAGTFAWVRNMNKEPRMKMTIRLMGACDYAHAQFRKWYVNGRLRWEESGEWVEWELASEEERAVFKSILGRESFEVDLACLQDIGG